MLHWIELKLRLDIPIIIPVYRTDDSGDLNYTWCHVPYTEIFGFFFCLLGNGFFFVFHWIENILASLPPECPWERNVLVFQWVVKTINVTEITLDAITHALKFLGVVLRLRLDIPVIIPVYRTDDHGNLNYTWCHVPYTEIFGFFLCFLGNGFFFVFLRIEYILAGCKFGGQK